MTLDLPSFPRIAIRAAAVERHEIAGSTMFAVAYRRGTDNRRCWFTDRALAFVHALDLADQFGFAVLDLTGDEQ